MSLVCIVAVICASIPDAGEAISCDITKSECISITDERETEMRQWCDKAPNCVEVSKRIFMVRESTPPVPKPPVKGGSRA